MLAPLLATMALGVVAARPLDGRWVGGTSNARTDGTNWSLTPSVPEGTATFATTGPTSVTISGLVMVGSVILSASPNANVYTIATGDIFLQRQRRRATASACPGRPCTRKPARNLDRARNHDSAATCRPTDPGKRHPNLGPQHLEQQPVESRI